MVMNVTAQARDCLPKTFSGTRILRECTNQKRDNIVLIEIDSDDFGDVIILDVPESFREKFRKKPKTVINIDDDDDDNDNNDDSKSGPCDPNHDATTSNRGSPAPAAHSSNSGDADVDSVSSGEKPIKLSKSKRTYSGKTVSQNRYGLSSDYICSSDSDHSDCEVVEDSSERRNEGCEKTYFMRPHSSNRVPPGNKVATSGPSHPVHSSTEEVILEECPGQKSNLSKCPLNCARDDTLNDSTQKVTDGSQFSQRNSRPFEMSGHLKRKRDDFRGCSHPVDNVGPSVSDFHAFQSANISAVDKLDPSNSSQQDGDAEMSEAFIGAISAEDPHLDVECHFGHEVLDNDVKSSYNESCMIMDRQKRKETDEYKRAMEEEWASRQQELQRQAEEARRLRSRIKAEKLRILANEKRQMQRLEEVRETRRKDEENLNLKDKLRSEIKKELSKLETVCHDMSSLLRCLGINVGGGSGGRIPSQDEIQAAYKRACLKFHPDRFSRSDLRQQVEAEEKFKLISTMKDKFLLR